MSLTCLAACDESPGPFAALSSTLDVSTTEIEAGEVYVGAQRLFAVELSTLGNDAVELSVQVKGPAAPAFVVEPHLVMAAASSAILTVQFVPDRPGPLEAWLQIEHNADRPRGELRVELRGTGLPAPDCNDDNACTNDWFALEDETCRHEARTGLCDDGNACTELDHCEEGQCTGLMIRCEDSIPCTVDSCDPQRGCVFVPQHDQCGDGDPCTQDVCDTTLGCVNPPAPEGTLCGPTSCEQFSLCLAGACVTSSTPDGFPCEDGDLCTTGDTCQAGQCQAGEGLPLGQIGPVEINLDIRDAAPPSILWVLDVEIDALGQIRLIYGTFLSNNSFLSGTDLDECGNDGVQIQELRMVTATAQGVALDDQTLARGTQAHAAFRDGSVFLLSDDLVPSDCDRVPGPFRVQRLDGDYARRSVALPGHAGFEVRETTLLVSGDDVVVAELGQVAGEQQICADQCSPYPCPPCSPDLQISSVALLTRFDRDLALQEQRQVVLATGDIYTGYRPQLVRGATGIDLVYMQQGPGSCGDSECGTNCLPRSAWTLRNVFGQEEPQPRLIHAGVVSQSSVEATYPAGVLLIQEMSNGAGTALDPEPGGADRRPGADLICEPHEEVLLFSGQASGEIEQQSVLINEGQYRVSQVVAAAGFGRLGALILDRQGGLSLQAPAQGVLPAFVQDLSLPESSGRRWKIESRPVVRSSSRRVIAAGLSVAIEGPATGPECDQGRCGTPNDGPYPSDSTLVVTGLGCGL